MSCKKTTYDQVPNARRLLGMRVDEDFPTVEWRAPRPALAPHVHEHWISRWEFAPGAQRFERLHEPCVVMRHLGGRLIVSGFQRGRQVHRPHGGGPMVGTKFRAGAFSAFSTLPSYELLERHVSARQAFGEEGVRLEADLLELGEDVDRRVALIEGFLVGRAPRVDPIWSASAHEHPGVGARLLRPGPLHPRLQVTGGPVSPRSPPREQRSADSVSAPSRRPS